MRRSLLILFLLVTAPSFALGQVGGKSAADAPNDAKSLLKLTDDLTAAKAGLDIRFLESVLDDDYVFTNPAGAFANKTEYIEGARSDVAVYESVKNFDQVVKIHGDAAVVVGSTTVKGNYKGNEIGGRFRFTNMYVKRKDGWKCIAIHLTRISGQ
jgi:ketosteroid isomerase-like protein